MTLYNLWYIVNSLFTKFLEFSAESVHFALVANFHSTRPDIITRGVAIEIKGPTSMRDLQTIADKCLRYPQYFPNGMICVLFNVSITDQLYFDWLNGMKRDFPDVKVIRI